MAEKIKVLVQAEKLPRYALPGDAGADLVATERIELKPGQRAKVATGVRVQLPEGYALFVMPRSGLAAKHGVTVLNAPGVVDAGYRGEIFVPLINHDLTETFVIEPGDRIAQMVIMQVPQVELVQVAKLDASARGEAGFGSTGVKNT